MWFWSARAGSGRDVRHHLHESETFTRPQAASSSIGGPFQRYNHQIRRLFSDAVERLKAAAIRSPPPMTMNAGPEVELWLGREGLL